MTIGIDSNVLLSYYNSRLGGSNSTQAGGASATKYAPSAPWAPGASTVSNNAKLMTEAVSHALSGGVLIDESAAKLDLPGASSDYKKLFALYKGLDTLSGVANEAAKAGISAAHKAEIAAVFGKGMAEVTKYIDSLSLEKVRVTDGSVGANQKTSTAIPVGAKTYVTPPLISGDVTLEVPAFLGNVQFNMSIKRAGAVHDIAIDLTAMGATPRTMANVVAYVNGELSASGVGTTVSSQRIPGGPKTLQVAGKPVNVGTTPDQWALKFNIDSGDTVTFSAPSTAGAVYVAQSVGNPLPSGIPGAKAKPADVSAQVIKLQTDTAGVASPPQPADAVNWVTDEVWAKTLDTKVGTVHATQVGPDGSVYVLADVTGKTNGQDIKGKQDVALVKYDSAGKLIYARNLGATTNATGLALAVAADGNIAIAGSVTGGLSGATEGALNSGATGSLAGNSDSFVTLLDSSGQEIWTQRRGARLNDEATNLAFGADGSVYVAGRSQSNLPGAGSIGGWDGYIEGFKADAAGVVQTLFTQETGSAGDDRPGGLVVDGSALVLASNETGHAVLRRFDVSGPGATLVATRDLGDLQGGNIAGLALNGGQVVVAGTTRNAALNAGTITSALSGGADGFAAQLSADLNPVGSDSLAYYGGTGDDRVTGLAVAGGKVFLTGEAGTDLPGEAAVGTKDGFVAQLDVAAGSINWSRRFTGKEGYAAPTAIAADAAGASILDTLGLPTGTVHLTDSQQLSAQSDLRAGDEFKVRSGLSGPLTTITIGLGETLDTLAVKLQRGLNYQAAVKVTNGLDGAKHLTITPLNPRNVLEILPGKAGANALPALGLTEGVVRATVTDSHGTSLPADGRGQIYGLGLDRALKVDTQADLSHALGNLATTLGVIRKAYADLRTAATPEAIRHAQDVAAHATRGAVPAYLTAQIANYQAGLNRLLGQG